MHRDNIFPPFLERKFQIELFLAHMTDLDNICSTFFEKTRENLKSLVQDKNKWSRYFLLFSTNLGYIVNLIYLYGLHLNFTNIWWNE